MDVEHHHGLNGCSVDADDEPIGICAECKHFERPPVNLWPDSAFGLCTNLKNIIPGSQGWGSSQDRPTVTDTMSCSNFEPQE